MSDVGGCRETLEGWGKVPGTEPSAAETHNTLRGIYKVNANWILKNREPQYKIIDTIKIFSDKGII